MSSNEVLKSLQELHDELKKLEPAIKHVELAEEITKTVKEIPVKHLELIDIFKKSDDEFKKKLEKIFVSGVEEIKKENIVLINEIKSLLDALEGYQNNLVKLRDQIEAYFRKIELINFPERLDKIDNSISAINIGIQNVQSRMNDMERQLLKSMESLEMRQKKGYTMNIVFFIIILSAVLLMMLKTFSFL